MSITLNFVVFLVTRKTTLTLLFKKKIFVLHNQFHLKKQDDMLLNSAFVSNKRQK